MIRILHRTPIMYQPRRGGNYNIKQMGNSGNFYRKVVQMVKWIGQMYNGHVFPKGASPSSLAINETSNQNNILENGNGNNLVSFSSSNPFFFSLRCILK